MSGGGSWGGLSGGGLSGSGTRGGLSGGGSDGGRIGGGGLRSSTISKDCVCKLKLESSQGFESEDVQTLYTATWSSCICNKQSTRRPPL